MRMIKTKHLRAFTALLLGGVFTLLSGALTGGGLSTAYAGPGTPDTGQSVPAPANGAENIRVMIMDTGYKSIFHPWVTLKASVPMTMTCGGTQMVINPGEELTIMADDARLAGGSMVFSTGSANNEISVPSVVRALGTPAYAGILEIKRENEGLTLINELNLENYLTKVIPSEMPTYYEMDALKAQAVCARTYAHNRMQNRVYARYGAHVDDSVEFQVYNNVNTDARAMTAVMDTWGEFLTYQGIPVEGYFFSTSCGYTTDSSIWKNLKGSITAYIHSIPLIDSSFQFDITNNEIFSAFIKDKNYTACDSAYPFYRWETRVTSTQLEQKVPGIGTITNAAITERGAGGIGKTLIIQGTQGTSTISGQEQIRAILGSRDLSITRKDNSTITGWETLPSAYITVENEGMDANYVTTFHIYGGGYGHGVGMSQNGAQGMARAGKNYVEILQFFFKDVEVR